MQNTPLFDPLCFLGMKYRRFCQQGQNASRFRTIQCVIWLWRSEAFRLMTSFSVHLSFEDRKSVTWCCEEQQRSATYYLTYLSVCLSVSLFGRMAPLACQCVSVPISTCMSVCVCMCVSICVCVCTVKHLPTVTPEFPPLFRCRLILLYILHGRCAVCAYVCLSVCVSVYVSASLSLSLFPYPFI